MTVAVGGVPAGDGPPVVAGHARNVLAAPLGVTTLGAIGASSCKLMLRDSGGRHVEVPVPACDGVARSRATHCHMHLERACPALRSELVPDPLRGLGVDRVNAYISAPGSGAALHFDVRTVVIVQLVGQKRWELSEHPAVEHPTVNCVAPGGGGWFDYDGRVIRVPTRLLPFDLSPGDWLVVPKATWHRTSTSTGSVSVTLALPG